MSPSHPVPLATWLVLPFLALVLAGIIRMSVVERRQKRQRRDEVARFAAEHGLRYLDPPQRGGEHDLLSHDFPLLHQGVGQGCANVVSGWWDGLAIQESDFFYATGGPGHIATNGFSIVVADLGQALPAVSITPPSLLPHALAGRPRRPGDDVDVTVVGAGPAGFSTMFSVRADDPAAARQLLGPDMTGWLVSTSGTFAFEVKGHHLLVWCRQLGTSQLTSILDAAAGFAARVSARA